MVPHAAWRPPAFGHAGARSRAAEPRALAGKWPDSTALEDVAWLRLENRQPRATGLTVPYELIDAETAGG